MNTDILSIAADDISFHLIQSIKTVYDTAEEINNTYPEDKYDNPGLNNIFIYCLKNIQLDDETIGKEMDKFDNNNIFKLEEIISSSEISILPAEFFKKSYEFVISLFIFEPVMITNLDNPNNMLCLTKLINNKINGIYHLLKIKKSMAKNDPVYPVINKDPIIKTTILTPKKDNIMNLNHTTKTARSNNNSGSRIITDSKKNKIILL